MADGRKTMSRSNSISNKSRSASQLGISLAKLQSSTGVPRPYLEEMQDVFNIFDQDRSGAIDPKEIREQMIALGFRVDNTTIYQLISDLDSDGSQKLEFEEFFGLLKDTLKVHQEGFNSRDNFDEIFDFLDDLDPKNRDGKLDMTNLKRLASVLGDDIPEHELEIMVKGADTKSRGCVRPDDFYELMMGCSKKMDAYAEELEHTEEKLQLELQKEELESGQRFRTHGFPRHSFMGPVHRSHSRGGADDASHDRSESRFKKGEKGERILTPQMPSSRSLTPQRPGHARMSGRSVSSLPGLEASHRGTRSGPFSPTLQKRAASTLKPADNAQLTKLSLSFVPEESGRSLLMEQD